MINPSLVALASGKASTIDFFCEKTLHRKPFYIKALITENPRSGLVKISKKFNIPCHIVELKKNKDFSSWDKKICHLLLHYKPRLVLLAGFLKKIGPVVLNEFPNRIINSHPSLLPGFSGPGMYGSKVHQAVIREGASYTGVSIHVVNADYDEGPLLAQKKIPVKTGETALELEKRVKKQEKIFYFETVVKILSGEILLP